MENNDNRQRVAFAAINPYIERNIVLPTERKLTGKGWVEWGDRNAYPDYLLGLSMSVSTLRSAILGTVDFIVGDDITIAPLVGEYQPGQMNKRKDSIRDQIRDIAQDQATIGGYALQVIRSFSGDVVEIYYTEIRHLRSNKDNSVFYYCEKWGQSQGQKKIIEYPAFYPFTKDQWNKLDETQRKRHASSIVFVKNVHSQVYPSPVYCAAVKACETERCIDDYHLNSINNGFAGSMFINFNNGVPSDAMKEEIERGVNEKFAGHTNAGRIAIAWNENKDSAVTITEPRVLDFGEKYKALASHVRQQIFTAFRANPNLFGIPTESLGFSQEEYESAFRLYNRTMVRPVQRQIVETYEYIYGKPGVLTIKPFSIEGTTQETNVN